MNKSLSAPLLKGLIIFSGLAEFLTALFMLFGADLFIEIYELPENFDPYYIRQIGMFQFLAGLFILKGGFQFPKQIGLIQFTLGFHFISLIFEATYVIFIRTEHDLLYYSMISFILFHIPMIIAITKLMRINNIPFWTTGEL